MRRRTVLTAGAAALAPPRVAKAATVLRFIPQADLAVLDPVQTTSVITMQHACLVLDTLYGVDAHGVTQPQMAAGHVVSADGLDWQITPRDGPQVPDRYAAGVDAVLQRGEGVMALRRAAPTGSAG